MAAYNLSGFLGSISISVTPVHSPPPSTFFQFFPPSLVLYNPLSPPGLHSGPCDATHMTSELSGWTIILDMCSDFLRPIFFHDFPPFSLLKTPSPYATCLPPTFSPVPNHMTEGSLGSMVMQPVV